jgi:hypothetical protein
MTSLERKSRAVNASDLASQFAKTLSKDTPVRKLKSKNSELLSKYREKLKEESDTASLEKEEIESKAEKDEYQSKPLPKVSGSFKGVNFDKPEEETEQQNQDTKKKPWRKGKYNGPKKRYQNDNNNNNGKKKFRPYKGRPTNNGKKFTKKPRF